MAGKKPLFSSYSFGSKYKKKMHLCDQCKKRHTNGVLCRECYYKGRSETPSEMMTEEQLDALIESRRATMPES